MNRQFKLALGQMEVAPGERERNIDRAKEFIHEAAAQGAAMIVLPEALPFGWMDPSAKALADGIPDGPTCEVFCDAARRDGIYVCTGIIERCGDRIFNAAVLIDPDGHVLIHHRKINELEIAHELYSLGDRLAVAETRLGKVGVMICADAFLRGQVISRTLANMGAQLIVSPCAWAVPPDHDNTREPYGQLWMESYGPVCGEFGIWMAGCSNVGPIANGAWKGHRCIGSSLAVGPDGMTQLKGGYDTEELLMLEVQLQKAERSRGETAV